MVWDCVLVHDPEEYRIEGKLWPAMRGDYHYTSNHAMRDCHVFEGDLYL